MAGDRFKVFRATTEPNLHVVVAGGLPGFDNLPERVRKMGPWQGAQEGELGDMRAHYRALLAEQGFIVLYVRQDLMRLKV